MEKNKIRYKKDGTVDKRYSNGGHKTGGRKTKGEIQSLVEKLSPMEPLALKKIKEAMDNGDAWAIKLFMEYLHGKAHQSQSIDQKTTLTIPTVDMSKWK